jgi:hypothetical protein
MTTPIRSNPKGYGIHSPFAFNLVTAVLFPGQSSDSLMRKDHPEKKSLTRVSTLLFRLLEFFVPRRIILAGNPTDRIDTGDLEMALDYYSEISPSSLSSKHLWLLPEAGVPPVQALPEDLVRESDAFSARALQTGPEYSLTAGDFVIVTGSWMPGLLAGNEMIESVCFFSDLGHPRALTNFKKLGEKCNVSQTYELNSCGIVIFNPKFQKEDFVIKGKKSY